MGLPSRRHIGKSQRKGVKLTETKLTGNNWREDNRVNKLSKKMDRFANEASEFFADAKTEVMEIQRERVKAKPLTHRDISSRGQERLVESIAHDKARRSQITELYVDAIDRVQMMKDVLSLARRDIKTRFAGELKKEFGAITNQHDGIEDHFKTIVASVKAGELLIKIIDLIINDIDKGQFSDKDLQKTAALIFHPARAD